jgi:hypothetical protein
MNPNGPERRPDQDDHPDKDRDRVADRVARCAAGGDPAIVLRLAELDREWEAGRVLAAGAAVAVLVGTALGAAVDRRLLVVPAVAGGLLLWSALGGRGPGALRSRGYRTGTEIGEERAALKALRGDFRHLPRLTPAADRAAVTEWEGEGGSSAPEGESAHDEHDRAAAGHALGAAQS